MTVVPSSAMKHAALALLLALPAAAQEQDPLFSQGKPPVFKEADQDRRFARSRFARGLVTGTDHPACVQLYGGLFTVLAEMGPLVHKRDENLYVEPNLWNAVGTQLSTPGFPGQAYLLNMMRRVLIDGKLPEPWLRTAEALNQKVRVIDLGRLRYMKDGLRPIDSWGFTLDALVAAHETYVGRANGLAAAEAVGRFRDTFLDREIAWGGLAFKDVGPEVKPVTKRKGKKAPPPTETEAPPTLVAHLVWFPPDPNAGRLNLFGAAQPPPPRQITVKLLPEQYVDLQRIPVGSRVMVRGRFWEMSDDQMAFEVREGLLFMDRDFSRGVVLADPATVAACPEAVNELAGVAPQQPGGFAH
jgi:hypothetical protein